MNTKDGKAGDPEPRATADLIDAAHDEALVAKARHDHDQSEIAEISLWEPYGRIWAAQHGADRMAFQQWSDRATNGEWANMLGQWAALAARSELTPWDGFSHEEFAHAVARDAATHARLALGHTREWSADDPTTWRDDRWWGLHDGAHNQNGPCPYRYREVAELAGDETITSIFDWLDGDRSTVEAVFANARAAAHWARVHIDHYGPGATGMTPPPFLTEAQRWGDRAGLEIRLTARVPSCGQPDRAFGAARRAARYAARYSEWQAKPAQLEGDAR